MVLDILRKSPCTIVAVMADAVEGWWCFSPYVTKPVVVIRAETERGGGGSGWSRVDTRESADIPNLF